MICFAWHGFPQYAARCVKAFVRRTDESVVVIGSRPNVPIVGMEAECGCPVVWVKDVEYRSLQELCGEMPQVLVVSGWGVALFNRFRDEVRRAGGKVIAMVDNNFLWGDLDSWCSVGRWLEWRSVQSLAEEWVKALRFRFRCRALYDGFLVPGKSGERLMRFYGVKSGRIAKGLYSADEGLFTAGNPLEKRPRRIIYVGQFIPRKNVVRMCQAFAAARMAGWSLALYGSGSSKDELKSLVERTNPNIEKIGAKIEVNDFAQPEQLAALYRQARAFILPSLEEHWGVVVHEAALSGCVLLLSEGIGAGEDFLGKNNGWSFNPRSARSMEIALRKLEELSDAEWRIAYEESLCRGKVITKGNFSDGLKSLMDMWA